MITKKQCSTCGKQYSFFGVNKYPGVINQCEICENEPALTRKHFKQFMIGLTILAFLVINFGNDFLTTRGYDIAGFVAIIVVSIIWFRAVNGG